MRHFLENLGSLEDPLIGKKFQFKSILSALFAFALFFTIITPLNTNVEGSLTENIVENNSRVYIKEDSPEILQTIEKVFLTPNIEQIDSESSSFMKVLVTGYSSTPEETDEDPFITASGKMVKDGIVAANFLPFGTKVRFPFLYPEKIFVVEDRMHHRFSKNRVDIWFPSKELALEFGAKETIMEILR